MVAMALQLAWACIHWIVYACTLCGAQRLLHTRGCLRECINLSLTEGIGAGSNEEAESSGGGSDGKGDQPDGEEEHIQNQKPPLITKDDIRVFGIALVVSFLIRS